MLGAGHGKRMQAVVAGPSRGFIIRQAGLIPLLTLEAAGILHDSHGRVVGPIECALAYGIGLWGNPSADCPVMAVAHV